MAALQAQSLCSSSTCSPSSSKAPVRREICAALRLPTNSRAKAAISLPKPPQLISSIQKLSLRQDRGSMVDSNCTVPSPAASNEQLLVSKLYAILEAVADRAEMHAIIGEQRNNWNQLLTNSINSVNLAASVMAGISSITAGEASQHFLAFKLSSVLLFAAAAGMMSVVNKIQPSQLAEEQRNATRLWKQLERSIETSLALRAPTEMDIKETMDKVLALDKAYPLPLLPGMLEKFPKTLEPTRWWPKKQERRQSSHGEHAVHDNNGWSKELEEEMKGALRALKVKDEEQYVTFGTSVLNANKALATAGPIFAGLAAIGSGLIGLQVLGQLPALMGVVGGALATLANTLEHSAQVGMVFELSRNCAGFYRRLQEEIESNLEESDVGKRENGEMFKLKMALQLGRSLSDLKGLASYASPSCKDEDIKEFAGKLF